MGPIFFDSIFFSILNFGPIKKNYIVKNVVINDGKKNCFQDLYSWIKMKLLTDNLFVSGSHLMLSSNKIDFPLKANTANKPINALPFFYFICSQITQVGFGFDRR